ncbi:hypothetical protein [Haloarcula salinisoli]|uniref:Uncharacterized protein n=1 Tax=Haloarcula salinisoli TaxID=2487746 RepID=A0A8J7YGF4_9EURY|nr:hypothetical protein [Halomicroarcula salinisoli]MBX0302913.1 hypothetical protein [Halomicroarcula salinisoli]
MGLLRVFDGGTRSADSYRSPTDEEARRIRDCFDAFDSSPGTVAVFSLEDTDAPKAPAVFVTNSFGQRVTFVHEELLEVATDDELAVAFAQATHRSPFANAFTVLREHLAVLVGVYFLAALNTLALWAFDVGVSELQGPLVPLVFLVTGLFVFLLLLARLEKWSFPAADDFACRHFGTTTVRRTYRALGDWLVTDPEIDHDDPNASAMSEPPLVRRIERLGGSLIDDTQLVAVTEWFFAGSLAVGIWLGNLFVRPVSLAANSMSATLPTWLVGLASALVGLVLAAVPLLVAYRRRGSLVDSLPSAARSRINTRLELPVVVVCSLLVTDLVLNGHLSFFWLALAVLLLFATGLSYRHQYYSYIASRSPEHPSAAEADRLRSCLGTEADSIDQILVCEDLWPWEIFVTGDDTHRRLYVERSLLETTDDTLLAVALAEAYERGRELSPHGRFLLSLWALCPLVMGYSVFLFVAGSSVWPAVGVAGALLLPVILFYNRRYAARFHRLDGRLCERFGSETVHEAYVSLEPSVQRQRSSTFTWRTGLAPHPPMKARLTRLSDPDNR